MEKIKPIFPKPPVMNIDNVCIRLDNANICTIQSNAIKNCAYVIRGGDACIFTASHGLIRFKLKYMADLGRELIEIAETWDTKWVAGD